MLEINKIHQGDCLELMKNIPDKSVDLILCDLPYGTTACSWDEIIPLDELWKEYYRIIRLNGFIILTASQPFTTKLINSNINRFSHNWVWNKKRGVGHLLANKRPLMVTEDIIVFSNEFLKQDDTGENPIREYLRNEKKNSELTNKDFNNLFSLYTDKKGCTARSVIEHYWGKSQFCVPTKEIYENILQKTGFFKKPYSFIEEIGKSYRKKITNDLNNKFPRVYNPQMRERSKHRLSKNKGNTECYGTSKEYNGKVLKEKYPINLISFNKSSHQDLLLHPTQKPVKLFEYLIKTYTNKDDLVLDNCIGSGTTAIACKNTNRNFIGIEKEKKYVKIALKRIKEHSQQGTLLPLAEQHEGGNGIPPTNKLVGILPKRL